MAELHFHRAGVCLLAAAALGLSGCDLWETGDSPSPAATPDASATPASAPNAEPSPEQTDGADDDQGESSADDGDRIAAGTAVIVLNDMDVYESTTLNCSVSDGVMEFDGELDGPHRGQTFLDGNFGSPDRPDSVGMMMDSGNASFPFWVVQAEDAEGRIVGEFIDVEWDADSSYVSGAASFEAVREHNVTLTDPPTFQPGAFEIHC